MARLTVTLPDDLHRALKEGAARRGKTIGELGCESLEFYGIKTNADARDLVVRARTHSGLGAREAQDLAVSEVRDERGA